MRHRCPPLLPLVLAVSLVASAAGAEDLVTAERFEALSEGQTQHFARAGQPFGAEQFLAGRRTLWRGPDGTCSPGRWYAAGTAICFLYDTPSGPHCWHLRETDGGLSATLVENGVETDLVLDLVRSDRTPLACPGLAPTS